MTTQPCPSRTDNRDVVGQQQMHATDQSWRSEYALWLREFKLWRDELEFTRNHLCDVPSSLDTHAKQLETHGASLALYGQAALEHEHAIAEYERGRSDANLAVLACAHLAVVERGVRLRDVHEQLKRLHHTITARCSLLNGNPAETCRLTQVCKARRNQK
jgi:hypothetical protein